MRNEARAWVACLPSCCRPSNRTGCPWSPLENGMPVLASAAPCRCNIEPLHLGSNLAVPLPILLAPMAGITSAPVRRAAQRYGAQLCTSEMIIASTLLQGTTKALQLARWHPGVEHSGRNNRSGSSTEEHGLKAVRMQTRRFAAPSSTACVQMRCTPLPRSSSRSLACNTLISTLAVQFGRSHLGAAALLYPSSLASCETW